MDPSLWTTLPGWTATGWTMLHMIWVGAAIGVVAAIGRRLIKSTGPEARYGVALAFLLLLIVSPVAIFVRVYPTESRPAFAVIETVTSFERRGSDSGKEREPAITERTNPFVPVDRASRGEDSGRIFLFRCSIFPGSG
jgi:hypothetical protein